MNAGEIFREKMGREPTEEEWQIYADLKKSFAPDTDNTDKPISMLIDMWCAIATQKETKKNIHETAKNAEHNMKKTAAEVINEINSYQTRAIEQISKTVHHAIHHAVAQYAHHDDIWAQAFRGVFLFLLLFATLIAGIGIGYISSTLSLGLTLIHIGTRAFPIIGMIVVGNMWLSSHASRKRDIRYMVLLGILAGLEIFILT